MEILTDPVAKEEENSFIFDSEKMPIAYFADHSNDSNNNSEDAGTSNSIYSSILVLLQEDICIELESEVTHSLKVSLQIIDISEQ